MSIPKAKDVDEFRLESRYDGGLIEFKRREMSMSGPTYTAHTELWSVGG